MKKFFNKLQENITTVIEMNVVLMPFIFILNLPLLSSINEYKYLTAVLFLCWMEITTIMVNTDG